LNPPIISRDEPTVHGSSSGDRGIIFRQFCRLNLLQ
jgi:hypothetical protein